MSSVWDVLNMRCLWDIPVDVSRKQMARTAGLDLREEVRPELPALRGSSRQGRLSGQEPKGRAEKCKTQYLPLGRARKKTQWEEL